MELTMGLEPATCLDQGRREIASLPNKIGVDIVFLHRGQYTSLRTSLLAL